MQGNQIPSFLTHLQNFSNNFPLLPQMYGSGEFFRKQVSFFENCGCTGKSFPVWLFITIWNSRTYKHSQFNPKIPYFPHPVFTVFRIPYICLLKIHQGPGIHMKYGRKVYFLVLTLS